MRYINTIDDTIQFIDVDNTITNVPVNGVYTFIKGDTISFILLRRLDNEGYCVMTTRASDVEINGTVYSIDDYIDGTATQDLYTATGLRYEVVEELPDEGQNGVIYLVPNEDDTYDEYIWLEDKERFERVGNTDVDLSDYYTKEEVDLMLADYAETSDLDALESEVEENGRVTASALVDLDNRVDSIENAGYATKTYVDEAIAEIPQPDMSNYYDKAEVNAIVEEDEEVTAAAIASLDEKIDDLQSDLDSNYYTETEVDTALANKQNTLTFDSAPTQNSTNPVTSGGVYTALQNVQPDMSNYYDKDDIDEGNRVVSTALNRLNNDIIELQSDLDANYYTESEIDTALAAKQNTLTFDSAPTQNSTNPVTSGGLYIVLGDIDTALSQIIGSNS